MTTAAKYPIFTRGDLNAFFALFLDNVVNLVILAGILVMNFGFPADVVYTHMIPGTALGVMAGDLFYSWLAWRMAKKTGRTDITAMPLGLDTPSTIGIAVAVLGPAFLVFSESYSTDQAAIYAWYVGMATLIWMGLVKIVFSFFGDAIRKMVPEAGLLGSLAGIGIAWLGAQQFIRAMEVPMTGLISLIIVIFTMIAGLKLPGRLPGAAVAVTVGAILYYVAAIFGIDSHATLPELSAPSLTLPGISPEGIGFMFTEALQYLPIAIPFGLLTIIGGINVTEGARLAGDQYKTRTILLSEAFATLLAGIFGGVSQSTPYIGHSAYKKMGARVGYTLLTGLLVGIGGMTGLIGSIVQLIPEAAVSPILIFVGFEITALAYKMSPSNHHMAVTFAIIPSILNFGYIKLKSLYVPVEMAAKKLSENPATADIATKLIPLPVSAEYPVFQALSQGFILTAMIWGAATAFLIDRKILKSALTLVVASVLSFFGIIHSATASGEMYLPWLIDAGGIPYKFAAAYAAAAVLLYVLSLTTKQEPDADHI